MFVYVCFFVSFDFAYFYFTISRKRCQQLNPITEICFLFCVSIAIAFTGNNKEENIKIIIKSIFFKGISSTNIIYISFPYWGSARKMRKIYINTVITKNIFYQNVLT